MTDMERRLSVGRASGVTGVLVGLFLWGCGVSALGEDSPAGLLGDVVLCPQVAAAQARQAGHSTADELLLLTTHGILHLLGYDHAEPDEEKEMFGLQRKLLLTFLATRSGRDRS